MDQKARDEWQEGNHPTDASLRRSVACRLKGHNAKHDGQQANPPPSYRHGQGLKPASFGMFSFSPLVFHA